MVGTVLLVSKLLLHLKSMFNFAVRTSCKLAFNKNPILHGVRIVL